MTLESTERRNQAESLILQGEQQLKIAALDFGMQFAQNLRHDIRSLMRQLQASLARKDEPNQIHQYSVDLQIKLSELAQQVDQ
ncbi:MAG: hypothetical protein MUF49_31050 [Oculatellaceae cyanobacterium Prado106]|jgi:molecular chaperone DnaK|nr:hypothetical protein [Oculatellaceae cyanobacterium Prado106]